MARKDKFDEFKLDDSDLDWSDFDEPTAPKSKNRTPIMDTAAHAGRSALSAVFPRGKRAQIILKGMPEAATDAYQGFTDAHSVAKDVYAHTKDELAKTERVVKQQVRQLVPTMRRYLPKKLTERVNRWSRSDEYSVGDYDPQQAALDRMMSEVFGGEVTPQEQRERVEQATEERLRDSIRDMKSDALMNSVLSISRDTHTLAGLASGVTLKISRKKLELQYRTLFAIQDLAKLKQAEFSRNTPALEAIQKNTALPDYAKEDFSEVRWANVRRQAAEWMNPLKYAEGFMDQVRDNTMKSITNAFSESRNIISTVLGMGIEDDFGLEDSSELSPDQQNRNARNKSAGVISSFLAKKFINPLVAKGQNYTREQIAGNPELMKKLQKAKYFGRSITDGSIANAAIGGEMDGFWGDMLRGAGNLGIIKPLRRENAFLDERDAGSLSRSAKFDRRSWLTLNEIIPAWLGRINTSIRRGYGENVDEEYDITTRSFTTRRDIANRVRGAVANDKGRIKMQEEINSVISYVDGGNTLTEDERRKFGAYIEDRAATGKPIDVETILKDNGQLARFLGFEGARKVAAALEHKAASLDGKNYELSNELTDKIRDVQHHIRNRQAVIDNATAIYGERALRDSGIFVYDKKKSHFGIDRDFNNPYVLYGTTESGKTLTGQALLRRQELERKIRMGGAGADQLRDLLSEDYEDSLATGAPLSFGDGGRGKRGGRGGVSARQLSAILYGNKDTNLVELLSGQRNDTSDANNIDRIIEAIRANNVVAMTTDILKHVKSMDEEGVLLATLGGGGDGDGSGAPGGDGNGPRPGPGPKGKRRKIILGEEGLARRWGGVLFDTVSGLGSGLWKGANKVKDKAVGGYKWARGKFKGRNPEGGSLFGKLFELAKGGVMGTLRSGIAFGQGMAGIYDVYDERGKVVLEGKKLEAGEYWQMDEATNKILNPTKLEDIELGMDIVDNNGNVVLSAADLAAAGKLRYYKGGKIQYLAQTLSNKIGRGVRRVMEVPGKVGAFLAKPLTSVKDWIVNIPDIYVKGEDSPRLLAHMVRAGKYRLKENNKTIYKVEDITGPVIDEHGNDIISAEEMKNPNFKLVDRWGRAVKSPLMRAIGRFADAGAFVGKVLRKVPEHVGKAWTFLKDLGKNNPLSRWLMGRDGKLFSDNTIFGGSSSRKTNHILIRIYKLLNHRLPGDPEDESWTDEMEKGVGGSKVAGAGRKFFRGLKARGLRGMRKRRGRFNRFRGWAGGVRDSIFGRARDLRGRAEEFADGFRDPNHDIGTRYEVEKRLYGRDDDVAAFYRDKLYSRGNISSRRAGGAVGEDIEYAGNQAKRFGRKAKGGVESLLSKMLQLQEVSWFNTMRSSMEEAGAPDGQLRGMFNKFSERVKFRGKGEKGEYVNWFKRRSKNKSGKKGGGIWNGIKNIPILGSVAGILEGVAKITTFLGKWGIMKPMKLGFDVLKWGVTSAAPAIGSALATATGAVVTALGWPVILGAAAVAGIGYAAYKLATNKYTYYLDTMRLAQYGYKDYTKWSSDDGAKALYLEKELRAYISFNEKGQATCRGIGGKDVAALAEGYGISMENKEGYLAFQAFMIQRFIPVYLRWLTALYGMERSIQLSDVGDTSKVTKSEMETIYEKVKLDRNDPRLRELVDPRSVDRSLWQRFKDAVTFTSPNLLTADEVMSVQENIKYDISRLPKDKEKRDGTNTPNRNEIEVAGAREALQVLAKNDNERRQNTGMGQNDVLDEDAQVRIQVDQWSEVQKRDVDALESLRFKTYGLKRLVPSQIMLIKELEKFVLENIDYKLGTYKGSWRGAISIIDPGVIGTPKGDRLKLWFTARFLPTFMFYVCGFKRYCPTGNPLDVKLTGGYLYELGLMVSRAYTLKADIRQSVWEVNINPFGEEVNNDPLSVNQELETLKMLSKEPDLAVRNMLRENKPMGKRARWAERSKDVSFYANDSSSNDSVFSEADRNTMSTMYGQAQSASSYNGGVDTMEGAVEAAGGAAEWAKISTGNVGINLGEVAEGNYKELRDKYPISSLKSEAAVKAMIADVAKKMGVPPGVALGMAYAESKFNYRAKNKAGSAAGLFQFIDGTWKGEMKKYAQRYGIPAHLDTRGDRQFDPWANALLGVQFIRDNIMSAKKDLGGKAPPPAVAYLYHFMGAGGGQSFLKSWMKNPNALATTCPAVTTAVVNSNPSVFYGPGRKMRTLDQVIRELNGRMGSIVSNEVSGNPRDVEKTIMGMDGVPLSSNPAINAGAANDPSLAGGTLPEDNAIRRDEVMESAGARRMDETSIGAGAPIIPGNGVTPSRSSDTSVAVDNIEKQAAADGMAPEDVAKIRAGAEQRAAATAAQSAQTAQSNKKTSSSGPIDSGLPTTTVTGQLSTIIGLLRSIDGKMVPGQGTAPTQTTVTKAPAQSFTQPQPSLNVSRRAS
ncbi:MAG: transglycosylase SLT domain-containing protein [Shewanella sp.]